MIVVVVAVDGVIQDLGSRIVGMFKRNPVRSKQ